MQSAGVRVPRKEAEATRRRLLELHALRIDLEVARDGDWVVFPVVEACGPKLPTVSWDFTERAVRPQAYQDLLDLPEPLKAIAPRAFDQLGDILLVKVPPELDAHGEAIGSAILAFHRARAVFADRGVVGDFRVRDLVRLAGTGDSNTQVGENGIRLHIDPARAYYSPRLASERARVCALVRPGEHLVDLFGGVAPLGIQAARRGAFVDSVDLNPAAIELARTNVDAAGVADRVRLHLGDARQVAARLAPADRIVMNLPHGATEFLDAAAPLAAPGATVHVHDIVPTEEAQTRMEAVTAQFAALGRPVREASWRIVRHYAPGQEHVAYDVRL